MNKLRKALALIFSLAAILCFPISASALSDEALPTIDYARTGSVDIYKYDLTSAEKDGVWNSSYVSTGVRDEAGVESILGNTQIVNSSPATANPTATPSKALSSAISKSQTSALTQT